MSDAVQIVTAVCGVVTALGIAYLTYLTAKLNTKQAEAAVQVRAAAVEVREVKNTLHSTTALMTSKIDDVASKVEVVHKATNSLKDELVISTDKAARAEGHAAGILDAKKN